MLQLSQAPIDLALARVTQWAALFVGGIAAIIALFTVVLVAREIRPMVIMANVMNATEKGDYSHRVEIKRKDELGELARSFNSMLVRTELFFRYVDKMVIERLVADERLTRPGGRQRDIAVIFGDMRGYTAMSNRRSADQVVRIVNTYFHLFIECVAHFGGIVDKTMGDAIMAIFEQRPGEVGQKHRIRAMLSVAYMKAASRVLNHFLIRHSTAAESMGLEPREFGFAIASGQAIVGNIGNNRRMDYTVCGRVVNLASRLESLTKYGEVIADAFTANATQDLAQADPLPPVRPKGFAAEEAVTPHRLLSLYPQEDQKMREFMKLLFGYSLVQEKLLPGDIPPERKHQWCTDAHRELTKIIESKPAEHFFLPMDATTGEIQARIINSEGQSSP